MVAKSNSAGELYFVGEKDPKSGKDTGFVKIGIVREKEGRDTSYRVKEHQTGNPRLLHVVHVITTPFVERLETTLHALFAPYRMSGEWFLLEPEQLQQVIDVAGKFSRDVMKAKDVFAEAEILKKTKSQLKTALPTAQDVKMHRQIVELRSQTSYIKNLSSVVTQVLEGLHLAGVDCGHILTLQERQASERFNENAFKERYGKVWEKYLVEVKTMSGSFRVVDPKANRPSATDLNPNLEVISKKVMKLADGTQSNNSRIKNLHKTYLELLALQAPLDWELAIVEDKARVRVGKLSEVEGLFTWKREYVIKESLDKSALKTNEPKKYAEFVSMVSSKSALIVAKDRGFYV